MVCNGWKWMEMAGKYIENYIDDDNDNDDIDEKSN